MEPFLAVESAELGFLILGNEMRFNPIDRDVDGKTKMVYSAGGKEGRAVLVESFREMYRAMHRAGYLIGELDLPPRRQVTPEPEIPADAVAPDADASDDTLEDPAGDDGLISEEEKQAAEAEAAPPGEA